MLGVLALTQCGKSDDGRGSASGSAEGPTTLGSTSSGDATAGTDDASGTANSQSAEGGEGPNIKFDIPDPPDLETTGPGCGGNGMGDYEFSYIWIANSSQGTVSKINTKTGVEEGRYTSGPMANPDPSRTSVNLYGDAVVVNRNGGIAKVSTRVEDCVDTNNDNMITTSTGAANILPWGQDECVMWHTPLPAMGQQGPRPVAWEGTVDGEGCPLPNPRVWVGHYNGSNQGVFYRLDGSDGQIQDTVTVDNWSGQSWGPYGGAVNADGDFWVTGWNQAPAVRIDAVTLQVDYHAYAAGHWFYGMALDAGGNVWVGGCDGNVYHFDTGQNQWVNIGSAGGCLRGLQVDQDGTAWIAGNVPCRLVEVDTQAEQIVNANIPLPGCSTPVGVSIDVEGFVWVVDQGGFAYKVDPDTYQVALQVPGLVGPYTYSDMTGAGLNLVVNPPK